MSVLGAIAIRLGTKLVGNLLDSSSSHRTYSKNAKTDWAYTQLEAEMNHQYAMEEMEHQIELTSQANREQYDYEYQMESPAARVAQYQQAGLNKGLMYSSSATGMQGSVGSVQSSVPSSRASRKNAPAAPSFGSLASYMNTAIEAEKADSLVNLNDALRDKAIAEAKNTEVNTLYQQKATILKELEIVGKQLENETDADRKVFLKESYDKQLRQLDLVNSKIEQEVKESEQRVKESEQDTATKKALQGKYEEEAKTEGVKRENLAEDTKLKGEMSKTEQEKRNELISRAKLNESQSTQLDAVARKYNADAEYREYANQILKRYGIDVTGSGMYSTLERFFGHLGSKISDLLHDLFGGL